MMILTRGRLIEVVGEGRVLRAMYEKLFSEQTDEWLDERVQEQAERKDSDGN